MSVRGALGLDRERKRKRVGRLGRGRVLLRGKMVQTILGNATTLFWGIIKSAFVLDKSLTPL